MKVLLSTIVFGAFVGAITVGNAEANDFYFESSQAAMEACYANAERVMLIEMTHISVGSVRNQAVYGRSATPMADKLFESCRIQFSVNQYEGNCRFDNDYDVAGNRCGGRSAQSREGGLY